VNGGCQRSQLTPPPHLELLTAGRWDNDHMALGTPCTSRKKRWLDMQAIGDMTPATMAQDRILVRNLTSDFRVDWALLPFSTRNLSLQGIQYSQANYYYKTRWSWEWTHQMDCRCNSCPQHRLMPIREAVGAGFPAPCLCRTSPSVDSRSLIHLWGPRS